MIDKQEERLRIGAKLKELREEKGLSVRQLAELTGVNYSNISKIESGRYSVGIDILSRITDALGAKIEIVKD